MDLLRRLGLILALAFVVPLAANAAECSDTQAKPDVGKPLKAASDAVKAKNYKEANAELKKAEAVKDRCPYENLLIEQVRAAVATATGDTSAAIRAHEALLASGKLPAAEQTRSLMALGTLSYQAKDYAKSISWTNKYFQAGGSELQMKTVLAQSYYLTNDCNNAVKVQQEQIQAETKADRTPAESEYQLLAACYSMLKDSDNLFKAREQLVAHYPKKEYWGDLIKAVALRPGFSDRLALDRGRLDFAMGTLPSADRYMELAEYALAGGFSGEAKRIVDKGFDAKILGSGPQADRQNRLRGLVNDTATKDLPQIPQHVTDAQAGKNGDAIVNAAFAYVGFGQADKAIPIIEQALASKAEFKRKSDAQLHLALAYIDAGQQAKAIPVLQSIVDAAAPQAQAKAPAAKGQPATSATSSDGTANLAYLWTLVLKQNPKAKLTPAN